MVLTKQSSTYACCISLMVEKHQKALAYKVRSYYCASLLIEVWSLVQNFRLYMEQVINPREWREDKTGLHRNTLSLHFFGQT
jgi:hypothetical protein